MLRFISSMLWACSSVWKERFPPKEKVGGSNPPRLVLFCTIERREMYLFFPGFVKSWFTSSQARFSSCMLDFMVMMRTLTMAFYFESNFPRNWQYSPRERQSLNTPRAFKSKNTRGK